jgi:uncharacterized protein
MSSCCDKKKRFDWLLWGSAVLVGLPYFAYYLFSSQLGVGSLSVFSGNIFEITNEMAWGMLLGILFVGILDDIPKGFIAKVMGKGGTVGGVLRATAAGVLLDLCSHGILLVGMKLYQRGVSLGQVMAFLIASPWNSFSLTLILWALVGFWWMLAFLVFSMVIAVFSGIFFDFLVKKGVLPKNPNSLDVKNGEKINRVGDFFNWRALSPLAWLRTLKKGLMGSKMILRWLLFGMILASLIRTFVPPESFETLFGPTLAGLGLTLIAATVIEVCSEGSAPIAADILTRAGAPGNSFAFLMTGVSTDYTEIISLKETTKSWKTALFLPLITLPQIVLLAIVMNGVGA